MIKITPEKRTKKSNKEANFKEDVDEVSKKYGTYNVKSSTGIKTKGMAFMTKEEYLKIRRKLRRQVDRTRSEIDRLEKVDLITGLSRHGTRDLHFSRQKVQTTLTILDIFDEKFGIEYEE